MKCGHRFWLALAAVSVLTLGALMHLSGSARAEPAREEGVDKAQLFTGLDSKGQRVIFVLNHVSKKVQVYRFTPRKDMEATLSKAEEVDIRKLFRRWYTHIKSDYVMVCQPLLGEKGPSVLVVYELDTGRMTGCYFNGKQLVRMGGD